MIKVLETSFRRLIDRRCCGSLVAWNHSGSLVVLNGGGPLVAWGFCGSLVAWKCGSLLLVTGSYGSSLVGDMLTHWSGNVYTV